MHLEYRFRKDGNEDRPLDKSLNSIKSFLKLPIFLLVFLS